MRDRNRRPGARVATVILGALLCIYGAAGVALAQAPEAGAELNGPPPPQPPPAAEGSGSPPPIHRVPLNQPITGSLLVAPPFGTAPLKVGFFALANDPDNIGFLTYQWNFGDGTVSSLPPELYIFHTYANPGNYVCTLIVKTIDGRQATFFQGVIVKEAPS